LRRNKCLNWIGQGLIQVFNTDLRAVRVCWFIHGVSSPFSLAQKIDNHINNNLFDDITAGGFHQFFPIVFSMALIQLADLFWIRPNKFDNTGCTLRKVL